MIKAERCRVRWRINNVAGPHNDFFAEWETMQIATIAMASHQNPYGVTLGGCVGHGLCTGLVSLAGNSWRPVYQNVWSYFPAVFCS